MCVHAVHFLLKTIVGIISCYPQSLRCDCNCRIHRSFKTTKSIWRRRYLVMELSPYAGISFNINTSVLIMLHVLDVIISIYCGFSQEVSPQEDWRRVRGEGCESSSRLQSWSQTAQVLSRSPKYREAPGSVSWWGLLCAYAFGRFGSLTTVWSVTEFISTCTQWQNQFTRKPLAATCVFIAALCTIINVKRS